MKTTHPIEPLYITIGQRIKAVRKARGISQRAIAQTLNYRSNCTLSLIERGKVRIALHHLCILAEMFNVPVDSLLK